LATGQQSNTVSATLHSGVNTIGDLQVCGAAASIFLSINLDGTNYFYSSPPDIIRFDRSQAQSNSTSVLTCQDSTGAKYISLMIGDNSQMGLIILTMVDPSIPLNVSMGIQDSIPIHITEYGAVGEFISGDFFGVLREMQYPQNILHNVVGSFRVRREL
jgi:hypothetical protein